MRALSCDRNSGVANFQIKLQPWRAYEGPRPYNREEGRVEEPDLEQSWSSPPNSWEARAMAGKEASRKEFSMVSTAAETPSSTHHEFRRE